MSTSFQMPALLIYILMCFYCRAWIIKVPYCVGDNNMWIIKLKWGKHFNEIKKNVDIDAEYTLLSSNDLISSERGNTLSITGQIGFEVNKGDYTDEYIAHIIHDSLFVGDYEISNFKLYYINQQSYFNSRNTSNPGIGLGFYFADKSMSLVHMLHQAGYINLLQFALGAKSGTIGTLYLGGIPFDEINTWDHNSTTILKQIGKCKVQSIFSGWSCSLESITFKGINSPILLNEKPNVLESTYTPNPSDIIIKFKSKFKEIKAPDDFILYLKDIVFKGAWESGMCIYTDVNNKATPLAFECLPYAIDLLPNEMAITINKVKYSVKLRDLFSGFDDGKWFVDFLVQKNENSKYGWEFGTVFLEKYTTLFDYELNEITFYSMMKQSNNKREMGRLLYCIVIVLIVGVLYLLLVKYKRVENKEEKIKWVI